MILKFEEITKTYIDGIDVTIDLGEFIDVWMSVKKVDGTKKDVGERLGVSQHVVGLVSIKVEQFVKLPPLRVNY
jgi:hypothetical protein